MAKVGIIIDQQPNFLLRPCEHPEIKMRRLNLYFNATRPQNVLSIQTRKRTSQLCCNSSSRKDVNKIWGVDLKPSLLACEIPEARKFRAKIKKRSFSRLPPKVLNKAPRRSMKISPKHCKIISTCDLGTKIL